MAITTYAELQSAVTNWTHNTDLSATQIQEFIAMAEADLLVRAELTQWDAEGTITITSGSGPLPTGCDHINSVVYGSQTGELLYLPPTQFKIRDVVGDAGAAPIYYTVIGDTLRVTPSATGTAAVLYTARFTQLSSTNTTNSLLTLFPDVYLQGSMMYASIFVLDDVATQKWAALFEAGITRIKRYMNKRKFGQSLQMRVA